SLQAAILDRRGFRGGRGHIPPSDAERGLHPAIVVSGAPCGVSAWHALSLSTSKGTRARGSRHSCWTTSGRRKTTGARVEAGAGAASGCARAQRLRLGVNCVVTAPAGLVGSVDT